MLVTSLTQLSNGRDIEDTGVVVEVCGDGDRHKSVCAGSISQYLSPFSLCMWFSGGFRERDG